MLILYPYAKGGVLMYTPSFTVHRRRMTTALRQSYPVVSKLSQQKVERFRPKFGKK